MESTDGACLAFEPLERGFRIERQAVLRVVECDVRIVRGDRLALALEGKLVADLKAAERVLPIHEGQVLTCPKLSGRSAVLLLNFNLPMMAEERRRIFDTLRRAPSVPSVLAVVTRSAIQVDGAADPRRRSLGALAPRPLNSPP